MVGQWGGEVVPLPAEDGQTSDLFLGGPDVFSLWLAWLCPHRGGQQRSLDAPMMASGLGWWGLKRG